MVRESKVSREIQTFLKSVGFSVWSVEQGYRKERGGTRQTLGIPDLIVIGHDLFTFVEVKNEKGTLRPSQEVFRDECLANGVPWVLWRDVTDAFDWCLDHGILEVA